MVASTWSVNCLPDADAKIVFATFHIMQHVGAAVDTVRKQEHKVLSAAGDTRLTRTKYAWITNPVNMARGARLRRCATEPSNRRGPRPNTVQLG